MVSVSCQRLIEASPAPTLCLDANDGYVVHCCNTAFSDFAGVRADQLVGRPLLEMLPHARDLSDLLRRMRDGRVAETLIIPLTGQGQPDRCATWMAWPVAGTEAPDVLMLQVSRSGDGDDDLREVNRRLLLAALEADEHAHEFAEEVERRDALLAGFADGVVVLDGSGRTVMANGTAEAIWGLASQASAAERDVELRRRDGTVLSDEEWPTARALRGDRFTGDEYVLVRGPEERVIQCSGHAVLDASGSVQLAAVLVRDVSVLRQLEQFRDDYLALISHDLRGPLTVVFGYAHRLLRQMAQDPGVPLDWIESTEQIERSADRINAMIGALLESSQLESGTMQLEREPVDLVELVRHVVHGAGEATDDHERFMLRAPGEVPVLIDPAQIERVVANLVGNAVKYSAPGTPVHVNIRPEGEEIVASVTDEGRGIAPEDLALLFQRYQRVAPSEGDHGHGLGLYISRLLVEAHGGRIWAESEPGKGSTFTFALPATG